MNLNELTRQELSAKLAADTEAFLEAGGVIEQIPYDPTAELAAKVGYWTAMGQGEGEFEFPEWDSDSWDPLDDEDLKDLDAAPEGGDNLDVDYWDEDNGGVPASY